MLKSSKAAPVGLDAFILHVEEDRQAAKRAQVVNFFKSLASAKKGTPQ